MGNILIVDNEPDLKNGQADKLRTLGHFVDIVGDGDEAFTKAKRTRYQLALVDLVLPGPYNGYDVIAKLHALSRETYIMAISTNGYRQMEKAKKLGASDCILKQALVDDIASIVNSILKPQPTESFGQTGIPEKTENIKQEPHISKADFPVFNGLSEYLIQEIFKTSTEKTILPGEKQTIQPAHQVALITGGRGIIYFQNSPVETFSKGSLVGQELVFAQCRYKLELLLKACEETQLTIIPKIKIRQALEQHRSYAFRFAINIIVSQSEKLLKSYQRLAGFSENPGNMTDWYT